MMIFHGQLLVITKRVHIAKQQEMGNIQTGCWTIHVDDTMRFTNGFFGQTYLIIHSYLGQSTLPSQLFTSLASQQ